MRLRLSSLAMISILLSASAFSQLSPSKSGLDEGAKDIRVGILAPLTGRVPNFGTSIREGALMAIDEWNAKGGVLGRKVVGVVEDTRCQAVAAVKAANKLIDMHDVHYLVGEACSDAAIPVSDIANSRKVVQIAVGATNPAVTLASDGQVKNYSFRVCFVDYFQGVAAARFALTNLHAKRSFIMVNDGRQYARELAGAFEASFNNGGGEIAGKVHYTDDMDFTEALANVAAAKPDLVYLPDFAPIVNRLTRQAKRIGIETTFMGGDSWDTPRDPVGLDFTSTNGGYFTQHYSPDNPQPEVRKFEKRFAAVYKANKIYSDYSSVLGALAYDATNLLLQAIKDAHEDNTTKVSASLAQVSFNGVTGKLTFDRNHNPVKTAAVMVIRNNKAVFDSVVDP